MFVIPLFVIPEGNLRFAPIGKTASGAEPPQGTSDQVQLC